MPSKELIQAAIKIAPRFYNKRPELDPQLFTSEYTNLDISKI